MTIAAGFVCADGIVITGDTEYTGAAKFQGTKIWAHSNGDTTVVLADAGPATTLGHIRDHIFRMFAPSMEPERVSDMVHGILTAFFEKDIYPRPTEQQAELSPSFLFAVRKGEVLQLYQVTGAPPPALADTWACIGYGSEIGQYLADLFYQRGQHTQWMARLAAYLVYQAKRHTAFCGGRTDLVVLTRNDVRPITFHPGDVNELEVFFDSFDKGFGLLLMMGLEPRLSDEAIDHQVDRFRDWLKSFRKGARSRRQYLTTTPPAEPASTPSVEPHVQEPTEAQPIHRRSRRSRKRQPPSRE